MSLTLAALAVTSVAADTKFTPISEDAAKIVFYAPGIDHLNVKRLKRTLNNGSVRQEFAQWQWLGKGYTTGVVLSELVGGYHYGVKQDLLELVRWWNFWKKREIDVVSSGSTGSKLDRVDYKIAMSGPLSCVMFLSHFGELSAHDRQSAGTAFVAGYHCMPDDKPLPKGEAERIVKLLGVKGYGVPDKLPGWEQTRHAAAAKLRGSTPTTSAKLSTTSDNGLKSVPLAARWEGRYELAAGRLSYEPGGPRSKIYLRLPDGTECTGTAQWSSGRYGTAELPKGVWSVACADGSTASGSYLSDKPGHGTGEGEDGQGRKIKLTYGG